MSGVRHMVLTAVGPDHPGLVDQVTRFVADCGGNLEDSRMVNLRGQFAMMMLVAGSDEVVQRLRDGLSELQTGAGVHAEVRIAAAGRPAVAPALPYKLATWAMDHPGLMQSVAHLLGELGVNIESADSSLRPAPYTNAPLFEMELVLAVPAAVHVAELREALGRLCDELNIDWHLTAL
jgi:glycine cleavage system transcriptional repressor